MEWGGIDLAVVPPPEKAEPDAEAQPVRELPAGPVLFYVHRDSAGATVIPVGQVTDRGLTTIAPGGDPAAFATRFIDAHLAPGTELALFRRGQRVGLLTVDGAALPADPVCRPLPRATGTVELASDVEAVELLALAAPAAPESHAPAGLQPARSMEVVGDMLARRMLQERQTDVPSVAAARRQLQPFPIADTPDPGFTATYLVGDSLGLGGDDVGAALFVVFTPRGQEGYQPAFVGFTDYSTGKAAPRLIDFLDWDRDGQVELLLEVFGTTTSWFRAVARDDGWHAVFEDRCDPRTAPVATDTAAQPAAGAPQPAPARRTPIRRTSRPPSALDSIPDIEPTIQLSDPGQIIAPGPGTARDTARDTVPPDTGSGGG